MIRYSSTARIERPPRAVYEALLDIDRYPEWTDMERLKALLEAAPAREASAAAPA